MSPAFCKCFLFCDCWGYSYLDSKDHTGKRIYLDLGLSYWKWYHNLKIQLYVALQTHFLFPMTEPGEVPESIHLDLW